MWFTLATADAVVGLAQARHGTVETYQVVAAQLIVVVIHLQARQGAVVLTFIIMYEDGGNVDTVRTGHAVLTIVAGNILQTDNALGDVFVEEALLGLGERHQRAVGEEIVLEVFHIGHAAEHGEHTFGRAGIAESPRGHATLRVLALQFGGEILWQVSQTATQQGLHDDGRNAALLEFGIQVAGIDVAAVDLVGIVPVKVVQLYLYEVPMVFVVHGQHLVEDILVAVEREPEVSDAARLALFHQEVHHAIVDIAAVELVHATANGVQQVVVDVVDLQLFHGVVIHRHAGLATLRRGMEVRQLGGYKILRALVSAEGDARAGFRLALTVDGRRVEIVHAMLDGIVYLAVNHLLVVVILVLRLRR